MRILIIEDDRQAASYLVKAFREAGHVADDVADGLDGYAMAREGAYDVLVVDRMLPKLDGLSLIRSLREQGVDNAGPDSLRPRPGRRPGEGPAGRRRRLSPQTLCLLRAPCPRRGGWWRRRAASAGSEPTAYRVADLELDRLSHRVMRNGAPGGDPHHA